MTGHNDHIHEHHHDHIAETPGGLKTAFLLNLGFTILEFIGGLLTNSVAISADALHDLGDSISLGLAWFLDTLSKKEGDKRFSYGYRRFSLLGALINTLILIGGGLFVLLESVPRILNPEPTNVAGMAGFAVLGIVVNGVAVLKLKGNRTLNAQAISWHLLEDVLGWAAVLIVSVVLAFTELYILDAILSVLLTIYVIANVIGTLRKTLALFLQAVPEEIDAAHFNSAVREIAGVIDTHHTHFWSLDGETNVLTTHVVIEPTMNRADILRIKQEVAVLGSQQNCEHVTIEVEYEDEACSMGM